MKKKLCLFLALVLVLSLAACGEKPEVGGEVKPNDQLFDTIPAGVVQEKEPEETEKDLSLGRMEGGIYTNEYAGFTCELDSNWAFMSAVELQQVPATVTDAISGSELADALENTQQFMDMQAENVTDLTTMNVLYQKMSMQERLLYATMSEEQVLENILTQKDMLIEAYAQAGIYVSSMTVVKVNFLGQERYAMRTEATMQDVPYYILQLYEVNLGTYSVTTTVASFIEDRTESLLDLFQPLAQ